MRRTILTVWYGYQRFKTEGLIAPHLHLGHGNILIIILERIQDFVNFCW